MPISAKKTSRKLGFQSPSLTSLYLITHNGGENLSHYLLYMGSINDLIIERISNQ